MIELLLDSTLFAAFVREALSSMSFEQLDRIVGNSGEEL